MTRQITAPFSESDIASLRAGDSVRVSGVVYTARDAAHKRMMEALEAGEPLPFDIEGQVIYYSGPCPARPPYPIGSCGPTTSGRMDGYAPTLLNLGLKGMIGKGERSPEVVKAIQENKAVYLAAVGGAGAYLVQKVKSAEPVAYNDLGPEAVLKLEIEDFPCVVAIDAHGGNLYDR